MNPVYGTTNGTLNQIISLSSSTSSPDNYYTANVSSTFGSPLNLLGGKYYYTELYHVNIGTGGFLKISVQVPNTDTTLPKQTFEVNMIQTSFTNGP